MSEKSVSVKKTLDDAMLPRRKPNLTKTQGIPLNPEGSWVLDQQTQIWNLEQGNLLHTQ